MVTDGMVRAGPDGTVLVAVHAQPGAARTGVVGRHGDALKLRVAAPADAGRANEALVGLLASLLDVRPGAVALVRGTTARQKVFRVEGLDPATVRERLDRALAASGGG